jgi:hypothetical protein
MFVKQWRKNNYFNYEGHSYSFVYGCAFSYYLKSLFLKFIVEHIFETKMAMVHSSFLTLYLKYKEIWVWYIAHDLIAHLSNNVFKYSTICKRKVHAIMTWTRNGWANYDIIFKMLNKQS